MPHEVPHGGYEQTPEQQSEFEKQYALEDGMQVQTPAAHTPLPHWVPESHGLSVPFHKHSVSQPASQHRPEQQSLSDRH